jgi:hypothetical protein
MQLVLGFDTPLDQVKRAYEHGSEAINNMHKRELAKFKNFTSKRKLFFSSRVTMNAFERTARAQHGTAITYVRPKARTALQARQNIESPSNSVPSR